MPTTTRHRARPEPESATDALRATLAQLAAGDGEGIEEEELVALLERAVSDTYRRLVSDEDGIHARLDLRTGTYQLLRTLPDGSEEAVEPDVPDFARRALLAAKGAVAGYLRGTERERVIREAQAQRGELIDVIVERPDGPSCWVRADRFTALLPPEEQLPEERLERSTHRKVVVLDARRRGRDAVVVVSRAHPLLLRRLLEQEVPELTAGQVMIRAVAREAGRRSKVAVHAPAGDVDAQGACIGPRGVRIRAVVSELADEQVQIVAWSPDPAAFVAAALAPASVTAVELDPEGRTAHVVVPDSQLSLAIGRSGENARLAARLTGWRIDIAPESGVLRPRPEAAG